jgi:hypothetical protein
MTTEQQVLDIDEILKETTDFEGVTYDEGYPLVKRDTLENKIFVIFKVSPIKTKTESYYNFKCISEKTKETFCFNGSEVLNSMLNGVELPVRVKLVKKDKSDGKFSKFYWAFERP